MNVNRMNKKIQHLNAKYNCKKQDINLIIVLANGEQVVAPLCDVDVYQTENGKYGIDLIAG